MVLQPVLHQIQRWIGGKAECEACAIRKGRVGSHSVCPFFFAESTYKAPESSGEYPTGAYPPKRTASVAKRKDTPYHARFFPAHTEPGHTPGFSFAGSVKRERAL